MLIRSTLDVVEEAQRRLREGKVHPAYCWRDQGCLYLPQIRFSSRA
jgi:hypothetical protein